MAADIKRIKVFMGIFEMAGYFNRLSAAFDQIGVENYFLEFRDRPGFYSNTYTRKENAITSGVKSSYLKYKSEGSRIKKIFRLIDFMLKMLFTFLWGSEKLQRIYFCQRHFIFLAGPGSERG
jgi:hypothetical protein